MKQSSSFPAGPDLVVPSRKGNTPWGLLRHSPDCMGNHAGLEKTIPGDSSELELELELEANTVIVPSGILTKHTKKRSSSNHCQYFFDPTKISFLNGDRKQR